MKRPIQIDSISFFIAFVMLIGSMTIRIQNAYAIWDVTKEKQERSLREACEEKVLAYGPTAGQLFLLKSLTLTHVTKTAALQKKSENTYIQWSQGIFGMSLLVTLEPLSWEQYLCK